VDVDGRPEEIKVVSPLANGLAEQAIKAVSKWRFEPATRNGVPIPWKSQIQVSFRLCTSCAGQVDPTYERLESARGIYNMGIHQLRGDLDKKDVKAAFNSVQRAASLDYAPAELVLGLFNLEGTGTAIDATKAADWFDRAAAQGNAPGEYQLARLYETGNGIKANVPEALRLYVKAAEKNLPEAQCAAGMLLEKGNGAAGRSTRFEVVSQKCRAGLSTSAVPACECLLERRGRQARPSEGTRVGADREFQWREAVGQRRSGVSRGNDAGTKLRQPSAKRLDSNRVKLRRSNRTAAQIPE
jgi:TonB family protein